MLHGILHARIISKKNKFIPVVDANATLAIDVA
jgi:hypothetical protein